MNRFAKSLATVVLLTVSAAGWAAPGLTPQQCNDYPFKRIKTEITHQQLQTELAELEAVGYQPNTDNVDYPANIVRAEKKLRAEYRQDCAGAPHAQYSATP
ncbi:hypothetical protein P3T43_005916 [Paraburkholderia sp. GAS41]|uniref:DUF4148 domain-containing protein n=1 Tax=Paraburkholderia sp. GAS41 TaxID=3035134 RepID=UPI003D192FB2